MLSYQTLSSASGYLDWILPAFSRNRCFDGLYEQFGLAGNVENPLYAEKIPVTIRLVSPAGLVEGEVLHQMERAVNEQKIMEIRNSRREKRDAEGSNGRTVLHIRMRRRNRFGKGNGFPAEKGRDGGIGDRKRAVCAGRTRTDYCRAF